METITDNIVLIWLIPVTLFIIIPLLISFAWVILHITRELANGRIPFVPEYLRSYYTRENGLQKRQENRIALEKPIDIALLSEHGQSEGILTNISSKGFCVEELADFISEQYTHFTLKLGESMEEFVIQAAPKWFRLQDGRHSAGFALVKGTADWEKYYQEHSS